MSDDFSTRYRLLKCVAVDGGIRTHSAQALATGGVVMVHVVDAAGPADVDRLRAQLERLAHSEQSRILETATLASGFAIVTEFLTGVPSFATWLSEQSAEVAGPLTTAERRIASQPITMESPRSAATGARGGSPDSLPPAPVAASEADVSPASAPPASASLASAPPGSFTKMFVLGDTGVKPPTPDPVPMATPSASASPNAGSTPAPPAPPSTSSGAPPGSFTKMFVLGDLGGGQTPAAPATDPADAEKSADAESALPSALPSELASSIPSAPPAHAPEPGAFTRMFVIGKSEGEDTTADPPQATPPAAQQSVAPPAAPLNTAPLGVTPPAAALPGAFTQMFVLGDQAKAPSAASTPPIGKPAPGPASITIPVFQPVASSLTPSATAPHTEPTRPDSSEPIAGGSLFGAPTAPPSPPPKPTADAGPGEFTRMFKSSSSSAPMPSSPPPSSVSPPSMPHLGAPTWGASPGSTPSSTPSPAISNSPLFGGHQASGQGSAHSAGQSGSSSAGQYSPPAYPASAPPSSPLRPSTPDVGQAGFGASAPVSGGGPSILPPPVFGGGNAIGALSPLGGQASAKPTAGPSDFTRMISTAPAPKTSAPSAAPTATRVPLATKRSLPIGLIVVINVVVIIAIVIVVLVMRRPVPTVPNLPTAPSVTAPSVRPPTVTPPTVTPPTVPRLN